mgnify:FL=1
MPLQSRYVVPVSTKDKVPLKRNRKPRAAKKLTRKQELFIRELVTKDGQITLRDAAINAGYSPKSAHATAYELLNPEITPHVAAEYQRFKKEVDSRYAIRYDRHLRDLQLIRDRALEDGAYSAAVMAEYRRGQAAGDIYISKSEIRHGTIDSMSKEEVQRALEEIRNSYAIDITPTEGGSEAGASVQGDGKEQARLPEVVEGERVVEAVSGAVEEVEGLEADAAGDVGHAGSS